MQHFPFYWSIFFLGASKLSVGPSLHVCNASSHFLTWRTFWGCAIISYGDGKPNLTAPNSTYTKQRGMREKGKTHEWESTPGNRSAQALLHEFRNFLSSYTWVNLFLFLFLCWNFLLQHHPGVGYFQEGCSPSVTCVPHLRGRRKRAPSAGKKIKTHVQDKKKKNPLSAANWTETPNFSPRPLGSCPIQTFHYCSVSLGEAQLENPEREILFDQQEWDKAVSKKQELPAQTSC